MMYYYLIISNIYLSLEYYKINTDRVGRGKMHILTMKLDSNYKYYKLR